MAIKVLKAETFDCEAFGVQWQARASVHRRIVSTGLKEECVAPPFLLVFFGGGEKNNYSTHRPPKGVDVGRIPGGGEDAQRSGGRYGGQGVPERSSGFI